MNKLKLMLLLVVATGLSSCKKSEVKPEQKLDEGCVKIIKKIAPNKITFINPDSGKEQTYDGLGNTQWELYNVGDVICKSAYFNY